MASLFKVAHLNFGADFIASTVSNRSTQHIADLTSECDDMTCTVKISNISGAGCEINNVKINMQNQSNGLCSVQPVTFDEATSSCGTIRTKLIQTDKATYPTLVVGDL